MKEQVQFLSSVLILLVSGYFLLHISPTEVNRAGLPGAFESYVWWHSKTLVGAHVVS